MTTETFKNLPSQAERIFAILARSEKIGNPGANVALLHREGLVEFVKEGEDVWVKPIAQALAEWQEYAAQDGRGKAHSGLYYNLRGFHVVQGDIFESRADVLINSVNIVGVMGKGLAKKFSNRFPGLNESYQEACSNGQIQRWGLHPWTFKEGGRTRWIINLPTKDHWRKPSSVYLIQRGLFCLCSWMGKTQHVYSQHEAPWTVALPALGCGEGGLDWESQVRPMMEKELGEESKSTFMSTVYLQE